MSVLQITGACRSVCVCVCVCVERLFTVCARVRTADRERDRDRDPGKRSHGSEAQGRNTNIFACATAGAAFDISTAVNYELACREVDRAVNMQNEEERPGPVQHACQLPPSLGAALRTLRPRLPETSIIPVAAHLT
ncbi:hypothetical protein ROHU_006587 [Labeo rohita]|uniref:Uncharacterized protein n=1 Tax=Labeo rohita TaxID=84645 RepID=A0A498MX58_LABRO|nr:hypothetical protein ROHU_006587 [Labeo rohita]